MTIDDPVAGYQLRGEYRGDAREWLATEKFDWYVTATFPKNVSLAYGRRCLGHWLACIDSYYLRKGWSSRPTDERTKAVAFPEHLLSNLHYHCVLLLPLEAEKETIAQQKSRLVTTWLKTVPRGTCVAEPIRNRRKVAKYVTKELVRPGYWQHFILASEFHSTRNAPKERSHSSLAWEDQEFEIITFQIS